MVHLLCRLIYLFIFDIRLLYYIIILILHHRLFSGDIYLSLSLSSLFVTELFYSEVFEIFVILSAILFPIKSPVASAVFLIALFEAFLSSSVVDCLA